MKKFLLLLATASLAMLACCTSPVFDDGLLDNLSGNNKIYYTSTDGEKIFPNTLSNGVDAVLLSNTYKNGRGCMTFDEEVTKIAYLFPSNDRLVSVELPNSLTEIGKNSFYECENLVEITIPKKVSVVSTSAFTGCTSLPVENGIRYADNFLVGVVEKYSDSYTIKNGTKWIGDSAFEDCSSLASINIPNSVTSIGDSAFEDCSSLASITIPDSVTLIGNRAFYYCTSLTSVTIPNSVTSIGSYAFGECSSLTSVTIGNGVKTIEGGAFGYCYKLGVVYCKPIVPPSIHFPKYGHTIPFNSGMKIYVPRNSYDAYTQYSSSMEDETTPQNWFEYENYIEPYDF